MQYNLIIQIMPNKTVVLQKLSDKQKKELLAHFNEICECRELSGHSQNHLFSLAMG